MPIQIRRDTAANWSSTNPTPAAGQPCYETDSKKLKIGDGSTAYNSLSYVTAAATVVDGDKGEISVVGGSWVIDNNVVTLAKMQDIATDRLLGRVTAGSGDPEEILITDYIQSILDDPDAVTARGTLGLGSLATQNGTFSGTHSGNSSGTNTGDQTSIVGISGTLGQFNTACSDADFASGGGVCTGSSSGTNTGDQTGLTGMSFTLAQLNAAVSDADVQPLDSDLTTIAGLTPTTDSFMQAKASAWSVRTVAQVKTDLGISGSNTGDQTSIVGISGTLAQFNTAISDADIMPTSGGTFSGNISVPDDPYAAGWDGSLQVPTKNAVYDKIQTLGAGGGMTVGSAVTGGINGTVLYKDASGNLASDADFVFDGSKVGIGQASPATTLDVLSPADIGTVKLRGTAPANNAAGSGIGGPAFIDATGPAGQSSSSTSPSTTGAFGSAINLIAGPGGDHSAIPSASFTRGGVGGVTTITGGVGGAGTAASGDNRGGAGGAMTIKSGVGGAAISGLAGAGGTATFGGGNGGVSTSGASGAGGAVSVLGGTGAGASGGAAGAGGAITVSSGSGALCTGAFAGGAGGNINITANSGGASSGGGAGGNGGSVNINAGTSGGGSPPGTTGNINIGTSNVGTIFLGTSNVTPIKFLGHALPNVDDGVALGSTSLRWGDLFLATGGVINWAAGNATLTHSTGLLTSNVDIVVPDEAYGSGWDGSLEVPTKNAVYDKIQTVVAGGGGGVTVGNPVTGGTNNTILYIDSSGNVGSESGFGWNTTTDKLVVTSLADDVANTGAFKFEFVGIGTPGYTTGMIIQGNAYYNTQLQLKNAAYGTACGFATTNENGVGIGANAPARFNWNTNGSSAFLIYLSTGATAQAVATVTTGYAAQVGIEVKLAATPTANAIEVNSSAGSGGDLFKVDAAGSVNIPAGQSYKVNGVAIGGGGGMAIGGAVSGATVNTILFADGSGNLASDSALIWDNTNERLAFTSLNNEGTYGAFRFLFEGGQGLTIRSTNAAAYYPGHLNFENAAYGTRAWMSTGNVNGTYFGCYAPGYWSFGTSASGGASQVNIRSSTGAFTTEPLVEVVCGYAAQRGIGIKLAATPTANAIEVNSSAGSGGDIFRVDAAGGVTAAGVVTIWSAATSFSTLRVGTLEFQPYALNNAWFGENAYHDGSTFQRRQTGAAGLFYFAGNEGQFRFYNSGSGSLGGGTGNVAQLKVGTANGGTVGLGGAASNAVNDYSGSTLIATSTLLGFSGLTNTYPALKRSSTNIQVRLADDSAYTDLEVADEAYGSTWNGSNEVPTKNAVYDQVQIVDLMAVAYAVALDN